MSARIVGSVPGIDLKVYIERGDVVIEGDELALRLSPDEGLVLAALLLNASPLTPWPPILGRALQRGITSEGKA